MDGYKKQAKLIKALAHPVRLRILELLAAQEACVCHLTTVLRQRQPYVSQQLMLLREAGLVLDRKDGTIVYYRLADRHVQELIAMTRAILRAQGIAVPEPSIPVTPVEGCPCPRCDGDRCCD